MDDVNELQRNGGVGLCMILRSTIEPPDFEALADLVKKEFGDTTSVSDNICSFESDACNVFWTFLPAPVPDNEATQAAQANLYFPDGENLVSAHKSHIIVVASYGEWGSPLDAITQTTRATHLFLKSDPESIGVYWGNGSITNSAEFFDSAATDMTDENLPLMLWIRFQLDRLEEKVRLYTVGMNQFGCKELETRPSNWDPAHLMGFAYNIANYLLLSGAELGDGDTIGGSPEERIKVVHSSSSYFPDRDVYQIQLPESPEHD